MFGMAFAQFIGRDGLRDIEACLHSHEQNNLNAMTYFTAAWLKLANPSGRMGGVKVRSER